MRGVTAEAGLARDELLAGVGVFKTSATGLTKEQEVLAEGHFRSAETHFAHIERVLSESRLISVVGYLPWVGPQVQAAKDLADMGLHLSRTGNLGSQGLGALLAERPAKTGATSPGQRMLQTLEALDPKLAQISVEVDSAAADRAHIPSTGLLPQLTTAVRQLDARIDIRSLPDAVRTIRSQEPSIRRLLGGSGAQTYLVLQQDPAELRATGGFIGSVGFLTFNNGVMAPFDPVDVAQIDQSRNGGPLGFGSASTGVPVPEPFVTAFHLNSLTLRDSNWSPDFPTSAHDAEHLLQLEAGRRVDGVIAIDPYLISRFLSITGPITVPETGDVVTPANFFPTTLSRVEINVSANRKSFLSYASKAIFNRLLALPPTQWFPMLGVLGWACDSRSLQANFHDDSIQKLVNHYRCGGQVQPLHGDGLMVIDSNLGANKDDYWLKRNYTLDIAVSAEGTARHTLRVHYYDLTHQDVRLTEYLPYAGWLRIYLPPGSRVVSTQGAKFEQATELGRPVVQGWFYVDFNKTTDLTIVYELAGNAMRIENHAFIFFWQKQAGRPADSVRVNFSPPDGATGTIQVGDGAAGGNSIKTDLSVDRQFKFNYRSP